MITSGSELLKRDSRKAFGSVVTTLKDHAFCISKPIDHRFTSTTYSENIKLAVDAVAKSLNVESLGKTSTITFVHRNRKEDAKKLDETFDTEIDKFYLNYSVINYESSGPTCIIYAFSKLIYKSDK